MRSDTRRRKMTSDNLRNFSGDQWLAKQAFQILASGKQALDAAMLDMGRMVVEAVMYLEREQKSGPDYLPGSPEIKKWASQQGSVYLGDQKVRVEHPRLRGPQGEIQLESYQKLKEPGAFSEELLTKVMCGMSARRFGETVVEAARAVGVSSSSMSRRFVEVTTKKFREFMERDLSEFKPFAVFIDTVHRGGEAFMVALGIDLGGNKQVLGFWEGATENSEICAALLRDLENRGLKLVNRIIWVTDGGSGVIKALRARYGKKLIHVRCGIHKGHNLQKHLAKRYRKEAFRKLKAALDQDKYDDAKSMLEELEKWLRGINESAANSLLEAFNELLTLHKFKVPALLRKTLWSTNPIESMFSKVRKCEHNVKRYRSSRMAQRWLASVMLYCEKGFRRVKGYAQIPAVVARIEAHQAGEVELKAAA